MLDVFPFFEVFELPAVFLFLVVINEFPKLDLKPVHGPISFVDLPQWFLLVSIQKYLNKLIKILTLLLILPYLVLPQIPEILFNLIPQHNTIIFD